jgi:hypothetical protein
MGTGNNGEEALNSRPKRAVAPSAKLRDADNVATHELTFHQHAALTYQPFSSPQDDDNFFSSLQRDASTSPPSTPASASHKRKELPVTMTDPVVITLSGSDDDNDSSVPARPTRGMSVLHL